MAVNDVFNCQYVFTHTPSGERMQFSIDYRMTQFLDPVNETQQCLAIANQMHFETQNNMESVLSSDIEFQFVYCFIRNKPTFFAQSTLPAFQGTATGELLPLRSATVIKKLTGLRGRSFRGRLYFFPLTEDDQNGGRITGTYQASVQSWIDDITSFTTPGDNSYEATVWSEKLALDNIITLFVINGTLGSQRSRQEVVV